MVDILQTTLSNAFYLDSNFMKIVPLSVIERILALIQVTVDAK